MLAQRLLLFRFPGKVLARCRQHSTGIPHSFTQLVPLSSLTRDEIGHSILFCKETMPPGSPKSPHDTVATAVFITKSSHCPRRLRV
ncbi:hypothetical protein RB195_014152 [Necator americanus]|uniref:Secreted protein n=1 Tax=Necator americanus TaxID=51031 RepID=A0ABR1DYV7_NECAM